MGRRRGAEKRWASSGGVRSRGVSPPSEELVSSEEEEEEPVDEWAETGAWRRRQRRARADVVGVASSESSSEGEEAEELEVAMTSDSRMGASAFISSARKVTVSSRLFVRFCNGLEGLAVLEVWWVWGVPPPPPPPAVAIAMIRAN